ncbi:MAG: D-inositol-3-phosphate glycosyltransferase [Sodalis sp. Fse]|nr:MAG: D-inositol-3-phosphate glycosyltransferase [Sodalis sp. Fse]
MHILIDVQGCQSGSRFRGIGRSALAMSRAIIKNKGKHRVSILLNGMYALEKIDNTKQAFIDILPAKEMFIFSGVGPIAYIDEKNHSRNVIAAQIRDIAIANIHPDVVYVTSFFEGYWDDYIITVPEKSVTWKTVCVCHDLIPLLNKPFYFADKLFSKWYIEKLANYQKSDAILAISHSSQNEMIENTNYPSEKIFYISSGVGEQFQIRHYTKEQKMRLMQNYHLPATFVMSQAIDEPRKNVSALIKSYGGLDTSLRQQYPLVFSYKLSDNDQFNFMHLAVKNGIAPEQLIFIGYVPDDDLIGLYNLCTLFVFPSLHEGFGLPPLEAMKCGAATIGSKTTSLSEVIGWDEATFDPCDINDIRGKIHQALTDESFYHRLKTHALIQAAKFSWNNTAQLALSSLDTLFPSGAAEIIPIEFDIDTFTQKVIDDINLYQDIDEQDRLGYSWAMAQNSFLKHRKKLLVDISELAQRDDKSGIQRVSRSILYELLNVNVFDYDVHAVYYVNGQCYRYANVFVQQNYGLNFGSDEPVLFSKDDIMLVTDLTISFFPHVLPSIEAVRRVGGQVYFVVHDILPIKYPQWSSEGMQQLFPMWLQSVATYGTGILCVSSSVADDVRQWIAAHQNLNLNSHLTINHFHLGANLESCRSSKGVPVEGEVLLEQLTNHQGFLMVGTVEPRKCYEQVLSAFEIFWSNGEEYRLIIVGKHGWNVDDLVNRIKNHLQLNKKLHWLQGVSDEYLGRLYQSAKALIFSSKGEGFGLPLIEAAQKGLPLILRDIPVFREIVGDNAWYFVGEESETLYAAIVAWIALSDQRVVPNSTNISYLTWKQSTQQLLNKLPLE